MKSTKYLFSTIKSYKNFKYNNIHNFMIKSGIIRKLCSGLYTWLPTGNKILNKIISIIKLEMNKIYAVEMSMPILQPENLWRYSNRINTYKSELMFTKNKNKEKFILSPTNEELISNIIKNEIHSLEELPIILFQIQNKFRNEIRNKGDVTRTKEFLMKDAYSFHKNLSSLNKTYNLFKKSYSNILNKFNLKYYIVKANSGFMGGNFSHEFNILSKYGDNKIIICKKTNKAENFKNSNKIYNIHRLPPKENIKYISYNYRTYSEIIKKIKFKDKLIKVLICYSNFKVYKSKFIALVVKFNDIICNNKLKNIPYIIYPVIWAKESDIEKIFGGQINLIGIFNMNLPIIVDYNAILLSDFITSLNINNKLVYGVNWNKDIKFKEIVDITTNKNNNNLLLIKKSLEVAHIFKLYSKYTNYFNINNKNKKKILMGSYGIGISRLLFSIIENNIKNNLLTIPYNISPFNIAIIPIKFNISNIVKKISIKLYNQLLKNNFDVIIDDRINKSFGYMINDMILLGVSIILIINEKDIKLNLIEIKNLINNTNIKIDIYKLLKYIKYNLNFK